MQTDCWLWAHGTNSDGYGQLWVDGKIQKAHRIIYEAYRGEIPTGLVIDHLCRVPSCINPEHLEPVTHQENVRRGKSGQPREFCMKGHKMTSDNVYSTGHGTHVCKICAKARAIARYWKLEKGKPE